MKETTKKNLPLALGLAIPVLMIVAVALAVYLPRAYAPKPEYGFLYIGNNNGPYSVYYNYSVQGGRLIRDQINLPNDLSQANMADPQFYAYDAATGKSTSVSFDQAQNLKLDPSATSPDGYQLATGGNSGFPFFFNNNGAARYLKGHGTSFPLSLEYSSGSYYYNLRFLGWVIKN